METLTVSEVTRSYGVSTRMLRYYEQQGLLTSARREGYAYRIYDAAAQIALAQVLLLRKLRLSVRQIRSILQTPDAVTAVEVFRTAVAELDGEIATLAAIRAILLRLVAALDKAAVVHLGRLLSEDGAVLSAIQSLTPAATNIREDHIMDDLNTLEKTPRTLTDVRVVYLPPATVAAAHVIGDEPEAQVMALLDTFARESGLLAAMPGTRHYGFNHPNPVDESGYHGYEAWLTVPQDWPVPAPLVKKHFAGGLYAAHMISFGNFHEWAWLLHWAETNPKYAFAGDMTDQEHMCGLMEEQLNYVSQLRAGDTQPEDMQLDLLMPLCERQPDGAPT
jgi:DNA-binding transcriptional MerR regulator